tara:strand:- start:2682 stop:4100 length:1419 start_codon:yes stop_codon:yes gene_type:complete
LEKLNSNIKYRSMEKLKIRVLSIFILVVIVALTTSCDSTIKKRSDQKENNNQLHAYWTRNANIYEVNIRQFTDEGSINEFRKQLPRLKKMGVDILWIMPIHPIGEVNRKGTLGSYYAVKDYKQINPEFGSIEDLRNLVDEAHNLGMYVILDWVANHSAWDNPWATRHPDWYKKDEDGNFVSPYDWTDVIAFDYNNPVLRDSMMDALKFWVSETDIDGYRCDVAGMVPVEFWNRVRYELDSIKPVFMLAEDEDNDDLLREAFDMNYGWKLHHIMNEIAQGKQNSNDIWDYFDWNDSKYPSNSYRMYFTSNHDENSWNGTVQERMGDAGEVMAVLSYTIPGMGMIYNGQEAGLNKRLAFFEKDTISWDEMPYNNLYSTLNKLKKDNPALWNGKYGGAIIRLGNESNQSVFAFYRKADNNTVISVLNLTDKPQSLEFENSNINGDYNDVFGEEKFRIEGKTEINLNPWGYLVLVK